MLRSRYRRILIFFGLILLEFIWWDIVLSKIGFRRLAHRTLPERLRKVAARFRFQAVEMGGVMIKLGQFLSSRLDVLPREITDELSGLQDEVRPEPFESIQAVLEAEFQGSLSEKFVRFDPIPVASASIGQVHRACLAGYKGTGSNDPAACVMVKVQRSNIQKIIETDFSALHIVARWVNEYRPIRKHINVPALIKEIENSVMKEVEYLEEGKFAETFAANFTDRRDVRVPHVIWSHTTRRVLTLEDVTGIKITDYQAIEAANIDKGEVARRLFDTYLQQIFEDKFFHADPHPGNLFVLPKPEVGENGKQTWELVFVDFGMVGVVSKDSFDGLRELLIAIGTRDSARLIKAYQTMNILLPGADIDLLERASERVFDRFWGKTTPEMMTMHNEEAIAFVQEFGELLYEMPFQVPENLIMLGRCVGILSGICTGLDPEFNWWTSISPYAQKLVEAESGGKGLEYWLKQAGDILLTIVSLPKRTENLINRLEQGRLEVKSSETVKKLSQMELAIRRLSGVILLAVLISSSVNLYTAGSLPLAYGFGAAGIITLIWILFQRS